MSLDDNSWTKVSEASGRTNRWYHSPAMVGSTLNQYRWSRQLGSGGMGEVYLGEDTRLKRPVAIKILPASFAQDPAKRERFELEAQAIAALNHPNIVTVHSVEQSNDVHFITMEYVEGQTLDDALPAKGLPLNRLIIIATQIVDAIIAAHGRGIVHRDLKPANVMLKSGDRVKVLDFRSREAAREWRSRNVRAADTRADR
jgi:serine/threonine protein kinase